MAVRLASEAYFGKEVLQKSTVYGQQSNTPLPEDKVRALKKKILSLHPNYVDTPVEFEPIWTKCVNAINHHASGLRKKGTVVINLTE
uniref:BEN domain-containing protein n=1 Tax=Amphimedon queenslandica TaxID=400682 RepID=A0A1X7UD07_AMPQE